MNIRIPHQPQTRADAFGFALRRFLPAAGPYQLRDLQSGFSHCFSMSNPLLNWAGVRLGHLFQTHFSFGAIPLACREARVIVSSLGGARTHNHTLAHQDRLQALRDVHKFHFSRVLSKPLVAVESKHDGKGLGRVPNSYREFHKKEGEFPNVGS